jgi:hypothetical protein
MTNVLVDSSVWIDFFNGRSNDEVETFKSTVEGPGIVCIVPVILQEVLQGFESDTDFNKARDSLLNFKILTERSVEIAIGASQLYRRLKNEGVTVGTSNDFLIATVAIRFNCKLLTRDRIFSEIAKVTQLSLS